MISTILAKNDKVRDILLGNPACNYTGIRGTMADTFYQNFSQIGLREGVAAWVRQCPKHDIYSTSTQTAYALRHGHICFMLTATREQHATSAPGIGHVLGEKKKCLFAKNDKICRKTFSARDPA